MTLRRADEQDAEMALGWRNHPTVRRVSLGTDEIPRATHLNWWSAMLADSDRLALIYEDNGHPAGVAVFSGLADTGTPQWSYYLDVDGLEQRERTLAAWLTSEQEILDYAFEQLHLTELEGVVLASNLAMLGIHRRFGCRAKSTQWVRQTGEFAPTDPVELVRVRITAQSWRR